MKALISSFVAAVAWLSLASSSVAQADGPCGSLKTHYGPFDFRLSTVASRALVEDAHFTRGVETLTEGKTGAFGGDIHYTLFAYPNHPRALMAMERLVDKEKHNPARGAKYTVECYYERALRFKPDDHLVRLLYARFLTKGNKIEEASRHLDYVAESTQDNPVAQFNAGMLYFDMKQYEKALAQAHRVIAMGFDRRELRDRLTGIGRWVEPAAVADAASAPASGASR